MPILRFSSSVLLAIAQAVAASPSTAPPTSVPTPSTPAERIAMAQQVNGLHGFAKPWHLKATYEWFGPDGHTKDHGTYEEWRLNAKQYRIAFHSPLISVVEYGTDRGVYYSGQAWPGRPLDEIPKLVASPMPAELALEHAQFKNYERDFGVGKMPCTQLVHEGSQPSLREVDAFCFAQSNAIVFYRNNGNDTFQTLFDHFMQTEDGHFLAHDMQLFVGGSLWLKVHVDEILLLSSGELPLLNPPVDAQLVSQPARVSRPGSVTAGRLLHKEVPQYPMVAKERGVQGRVIIACTIDKTGHAKEVSVLAGPPLLQQAAADAVRHWVWNPYLLDGVPVEVETTLNVIFNLAG